MLEILKLNDLNGLVSQCHVYRYLYNFYVVFEVLGLLIELKLTYSVSCLHDMTIYSIQVKMAKGCHALTMNLVAHIMMYKTKERYLH